jgi:hypothetical protein
VVDFPQDECRHALKSTIAKPWFQKVVTNWTCATPQGLAAMMIMVFAAMSELDEA